MKLKLSAVIDTVFWGAKDTPCATGVNFSTVGIEALILSGRGGQGMNKKEAPKIVFFFGVLVSISKF